MKRFEYTNKRKKDQLGMPLGTAAARLRKIVLFSVLQRHNENICYQCKSPINTAEELSIEHKNPWLDMNPSLFWDLDNIAFSHLRCNIQAAKRKPSKAFFDSSIFPRKEGPEGTAWCRGHQDFLPTYKFSKNSFNWNNLQGECNDCRSERRNASYAKRKMERETGVEPAGR